MLWEAAKTLRMPDTPARPGAIKDAFSVFTEVNMWWALGLLPDTAQKMVVNADVDPHPLPRI